MTLYRVPLDADSLLLRSSEEPIDIYADHSLLIVPRGSILRFIVPAGSTTLMHGITFFTNYPPRGTTFERNTYYSYHGYAN
jgi:hypothetical protein